MQCHIIYAPTSTYQHKVYRIHKMVAYINVSSTYWFSKVLIRVRINVDLPTFLVPQTRITAQPSMSPMSGKHVHNIRSWILLLLLSNIEHTDNNILIIVVLQAAFGFALWGKNTILHFYPLNAWRGRTSAGTDNCVKSISVAPWRFQALDSADQWNHSQTIERRVKDGWHEFTLQTRSDKKLLLETHKTNCWFKFKPKLNVCVSVSVNLPLGGWIIHWDL